MKHEIVASAVQFADVFHNAPDIHAFDPKDSQGNIIFDSGKHIMPGAVIGVGIAMYVDSFKKRIPAISNLYATLGGFVAATLYEGYDACGESVPGAKGIVETCQAGFLDGATANHAKVDSVLDIITTTGSSLIGAAIATKVAFEATKKFTNSKFYIMKQSELNKLKVLDLAPSKDDMRIITVVED